MVINLAADAACKADEFGWSQGLGFGLAMLGGFGGMGLMIWLFGKASR